MREGEVRREVTNAKQQPDAEHLPRVEAKPPRPVGTSANPISLDDDDDNGDEGEASNAQLPIPSRPPSPTKDMETIKNNIFEMFDDVPEGLTEDIARRHIGKIFDKLKLVYALLLAPLPLSLSLPLPPLSLSPPLTLSPSPLGDTCRIDWRN